MKIHKKQLLEIFRIYGASTVISLIATAITKFLGIILNDTPPFLLLLVAVTANTWFVGMRAGVFSTMLLTAVVLYYFLPPQTSFLINNLKTASYIIVFIFSCLSILFIIYRSRLRQKVRAFAAKEEKYLTAIKKLKQDNLRYQKEVKARDEFLSIASHELKTPLTSMLLQLQTAIFNIRHTSLANFSVGTLMKMLESTEQQTFRLAKMINDLLNVSLITTGRMELEKAKMDLAPLVKEICERFNTKDERDEDRIKIKTDPKIIGTWDKLRVEQVITNLVSNAVKYGNNKPIKVIAIKYNNVVRLTVSDQGIGIPKEDQGRIFEKFERAVNHNHYQGLGVGLYISHQIVKAHRGSITFVSKPNAGSTFTVELPLKAD